MTVTRAAAIARAAARLAAAGVPGASRDARLLYRWAAGLTGASLSASLGDVATPEELARFEQGTAARERRVPVSHIIGMRSFWGRDFAVTPDVLDPRPETETMIAALLAGPPAGRILDLGTGSGCILLTLLAEWPAAQGLGVDISPPAISVARRNAASLGVAERADFTTSDWFGLVEARFDLIVSNPPYIAEIEMATLTPEVRHEPRMALTPGGDGLDAYRIIARGLSPHLAAGGRVALEIGPTQGSYVGRLLLDAGLRNVWVLPDMDGRDRVICADA